MSQETGKGEEEGVRPPNPQHQAASKRVQQTQAQVDEPLLRAGRHYYGDALQQGASQFEQHAGKLKRKFWWKNLKMIAIMVIIGVIFVLIIT
ncbi:synaptobrevin-like, partial [Limulus polyphemus]|uniref:Synaptobrevin-like n=1 Tax=Limulus polyphemus TaxID=6850 RepID=A0ABM1C1K5_LIMPO